MKKSTLLFSATMSLLAIYLVVFSPFSPSQTALSTPQLRGEITTESTVNQVQSLTIKAEDGQTIQIENDLSLFANPRTFKQGQEVMLQTYDQQHYYISDHVREKPLLILAALFVTLVLLVTRSQGLGSLAGMIFSFIIIFQFILPQILAGKDPVTTVILGAALIIPTTFYASHGINKKTTTAVIGTLITLIITAILANIFTELANISGTASEEVSFLSLDAASNIDFKGLFLAGMILSLLGILDDITISQASVVSQLKAANTKQNAASLYKGAMAVGRDHISSLVNTLILVYAGASIPLLLLFLDHSQHFLDIVNYEFMAEEILHTFIGSIGIVLAVPITTILAVFVVDKAKKGSSAGCGHIH